MLTIVPGLGFHAYLAYKALGSILALHEQDAGFHAHLAYERPWILSPELKSKCIFYDNDKGSD